jgi:hypothetical protein
MFGKDTVKNLIDVNSINEKLASRATKKNEKILEGMKKAYLEKIQTTYTNMSTVIDDGLKRSYERSLVAFNNNDLDDLNVQIVASVSFALQNISGLAAFIKIIEDYSKEYNIKFVDANFKITNYDFDILHWVNGLRDMFVAIDPLNERNNILTVDERIYLFEHEDTLTKDAIRRVFSKELNDNDNILRLTLKFTSKWTIMDNGEDERIEQDPYKPQCKAKKIDEQKILFSDFNNVVTDVCKVLSDMFKSNIIRSPKRPFQHEDEYQYNPNTWNYSTSTIYKNKNK